MKLPLGFGTLDFSNWLYGLWVGVVGGGSTAVIGGLTLGSKDPYYAFGTAQSLDMMWSMFVVAGLYSGFAYLAKHPAPDRVIEKTEQTVERKPGAVVTTTVKETSVEPPVAPPKE